VEIHSSVFIVYYRCIAVCSLGIYLYEEITHGTLHKKFVEAINVLLATLGVSIDFLEIHHTLNPFHDNKTSIKTTLNTNMHTNKNHEDNK